MRTDSSKTPFTDTPAQWNDALAGFSEEQLRFLAETVPQIAWTALPDGSMDYMNSRWFNYTGLTAKETYEELNAAVHEDDLKHYRERWDHSLQTLEPYEVEYRFRRASDGMYRWHLGLAVPIMDHQGKVIRWFGTCTDIHDQKEAEAEMRLMNEKLESIVKERTLHLQEEIERRRFTEQKYVEQLLLLERMIDGLPIAAAAVSSGDKILHANEAFRSLFGLQLSDMSVAGGISGSSVLHKAHERLSGSGWAQFFAHMERSAAYGHEVTHKKDGRIFFLEYSPSNADIGSYLLLIRDITQEKREDSVKSEFMSLASHQLRTPLTSIRWALGRFSRSMSDRLMPEETRLLAIMRESAAAMADTIRTMLSISRVEAGLQPVTTSSFSLQKFLQLFEESFRDSARLKNITLTIECPEDISILSDRLVLREIIENLLTNAIKYTLEKGSVTLRAWQEGDSVVIEVKDTGVGIPDYQQEKIFTKFFRAENILLMDMQGTGLGLYLVSKLTNALQATISFTSKVGEGTSFILKLPLYPQDQ